VRAAAKFTSIKVVPIVGGMAAQKQQRLLKQQPHIVVGTPGRVWELMSGGESHLLELSLLSFFVLDEADRMVEKGHFQELQSIIDMLPSTKRKLHSHSLVQASTVPNGKLPRHESESDEREAPTHREEGVEEMPVDGVQSGSDIHEPQNETLKKKRQTLVFSATLALPPGFKKKLKRGFLGDKGVSKKNEYSVASLSERAGVSHQAAVIDLTTQTVVAKKLEESVIE
jgi:ATP-dependent RNA helicase DDX24/MAK5